MESIFWTCFNALIGHFNLCPITHKKLFLWKLIKQFWDKNILSSLQNPNPKATFFKLIQAVPPYLRNQIHTYILKQSIIIWCIGWGTLVFPGDLIIFNYSKLGYQFLLSKWIIDCSLSDFSPVYFTLTWFYYFTMILGGEKRNYPSFLPFCLPPFLPSCYLL